MVTSLELEPRVEPKPKARLFIRSISMVAALSLAACGGGGEDGREAANRDVATSEGERSSEDSTSSSTSSTDSLPTSSTVTETTVTTAPTTTETLPPAPVTTRQPVTAPPSTARPAPTTPPTQPPPSPQLSQLATPTNLRVMSPALRCYDVPAPPPGVRDRYGRMCDIDIRAVQRESRPEGSGQKVITRFFDCPPNETPYNPAAGGPGGANTPESHYGRTAAWLCDNTWANPPSQPENISGEVHAELRVQADTRICLGAYTELNVYNNQYGTWESQQVSDYIGMLCITADENGNITS